MDASTQSSPVSAQIPLTFPQRIGRWFVQRGESFAAGLLTAAITLYWMHLQVTTWGMSSLTTGSLLAAGVLFLACSGWRPNSALRLGGLAVLCGLTLSTPWWWASWDAALASVIGSAGVWLACLLNGALLAGLMLSLAWWNSRKEAAIGTNSLFWLGLAGGFWLATAALAPLMPTYWLAAAATVGFAVQMMIPSARPVDNKQFAGWPRLNFSPIVSALLLGGCLPAVFRIASQLQPETTLVFFGVIASFCLGLALSRWKWLSERQLVVLTVAALVLACFPLWIRYYLLVSSSVSMTSLAIVLRQLGLIAFFAPFGLLVGCVCLPTGSRAEGKLFVQSWQISCFALLTGATVGWSLISAFGPVLLVAVCLIAFAVLTCLRGENGFVWKQLAQPRRVVPAAVAASACVALVWSYQPEFSARSLFSTHVFQSWRNGRPLNTVPGLDDGRLLSVRESSSGTLTVWRHQGTHCQLRLNGVPAGRISSNATLVPQPAGGTLSAVLPLSLHPAPRQVLLLGLESGLGLKTTLEFPVMQVDCCEQNDALLQEMQSGALSETLASCWADDRVQLQAGHPALTVRQLKAKYDVILDTPGNSAVYRQADQFNAGRYAWLAERLAEGGLYCQRFTFTDYGPDALRSVAETLQSAFGYVTAFDTAPGEMLFVAARSREDVVTKDLIQRVSAPQVRRSLARIGWDWSVAMNLAHFEQDALQEVKGYGLQNAWSSPGSFRLATEMMRWGNKWDEVRTVLANKPQHLLEHYAEEKEMADVLRRLSDVAAREQVLVKHTDQFWVYRKSVKKRLQDEPRTIIEPVKGEGLQKRIHPDDQRRLDYFETLGNATQQKACSLESLSAVEEYAYPYDPLVSYFMHAEIAKLYQRSAPPQPDLELRHWLHSLYFGSQQERSVRSIHRSLELIANADTEFTAAERYDHANTLMELLKIRWHMRKGKQDLSQAVLLIDLKDSLRACNLALEAMPQLGEEAGIDPAQTEVRIAELERTLTRMLQSHRAEMLAKASKPNYPLPPADE